MIEFFMWVFVLSVLAFFLSIFVEDFISTGPNNPDLFDRS